MRDTTGNMPPFTDKTGNDLTDDELLRGLWWGDPEFGPAVNALHREYVERRHAWMDYKLRGGDRSSAPAKGELRCELTTTQK